MKSIGFGTGIGIPLLFPISVILAVSSWIPLFTALQSGTAWDNKKFRLYIIIVLRQALPIILVGA